MKHLTLCALLLTTACGTVKPVDLADAGTTAFIVAQGGTELNPLIGAAGDSAAPLVALGLKAGVRYAAQGTEDEEQVNKAVDAGSWIGACNNILQLAGAELSVSLTVGLLCGLASWNMDS